MTTTANAETITVTDADGNELTVNLDQATDLIAKLLAARKEGYAARRQNRSAALATAKAQRATAKADRTAAAAAKRADQVAKLELKLKELKAKKTVTKKAA